MSKPVVIDPRAPKGEFMIAFDTSAVKSAGAIHGVKVTLEIGTLMSEESAAVNLTEHPLYPHLRQYVLSNLKNTRG